MVFIMQDKKVESYLTTVPNLHQVCLEAHLTILSSIFSWLLLFLQYLDELVRLSW
jgi:hypothetical protein